MKKISVILPCRNEEENVQPITHLIIDIIEKLEIKYDYEIIFIDNFSTDKTREKIKELCSLNPKVRALFNTRNFKYTTGFYALLQATGDCVITMAADFQEPAELIIDFVREWENGAKIVCAVKKHSDENAFIYFLRTLYYKLLNKLSENNFIEHFTGFGLYDREFVEILRGLGEVCPYMRGFVAELGYKIKTVEYHQPKRKSGISKQSFSSLYNIAIRSFVTYATKSVRIAFLGGILSASLSLSAMLMYFFSKNSTNKLRMSMTEIVSLFVNSIQLFFIGLLGEYMVNINTRLMKRPLVIEEERVNFD